MEATIELWGVRATLKNWMWECADPLVKRILNSTLDEMGPGPDDPQPAITEAERVAKEYGGQVIRRKAARHIPGRVY